MDQRVSMFEPGVGPAGIQPLRHDEFLNFCRLTRAQPQICLNLGSGTAEEAAEWVKYVNAHWGAAGLTWELGNELWATARSGIRPWNGWRRERANSPGRCARWTLRRS